MHEVSALELAAHLRRNHQDQAAANVLCCFLNTAAGRPEAWRARAALAAIAVRHEKWEQALQLGREIAAARPDHREAWFWQALALACLGRLEEAEAIAPRLHAAADAGADLDEMLRPAWYLTGCALNAGDLARADRLFDLFAVPGSYAHRIAQPPSETSDAELCARLDAALAEWRAAGEPLPDAAWTSDAPPARKQRVLVVHRQYFMGRPPSREHELKAYLEGSLRALGHEPISFAAEPFNHTIFFTPQQQMDHFDALLAAIERERPDVVLFDELCLRRCHGLYLTPEVYRDALLEMKARCGFRLVAFYPDAWDEDSQEAMRFVRGVADVVWPLCIGGVADWSGPARLSPAPQPFPVGLFGARGARDIAAGWVGGVHPVNYTRVAWLLLMRTHGVPCTMRVTSHTAEGSAAGGTPEEYARFMARMKITVNFAARTGRRAVLTGRTWEAILSGSLVLEEANPETPRYFVPFVHYVPFRTVGELDAWLRFFARHDDLRAQMAERALDWYRARYTPDRVWNGLFAALEAEQPVEEASPAVTLAR